MSQYSLELPNYLKNAASKVAQKEGVSLNQLFVIAIAEKISALETEDLLENMAANADEEEFFNALAKVPDEDVIEGDENI